MKILKEITEWDTEHVQPNHTYFVKSDKCHAYVKEGTKTIILFDKPKSFSRSHRKFEDITAKHGMLDTKISQIAEVNEGK